MKWFIGDGTFIRYLLVGVSISALDLALFTLFSVVFGLNEIIANVASTVISICVSYLINRIFVFRGGGGFWSNFFSFAGVTLFTGLVLQSLVIWACAALAFTAFPSSEAAIVLPLAKVVAMGVGAVANYLGYRFVFRKADASNA